MEAISGRRVNASSTRFSFLTEHMRLDDDSPMTKAKRAEFVRSILRPAVELTNELKEETAGLQENVRTEISICLEGMKNFVERKLLEGERKLQKVQQQLERQEREFRKDEDVKTLLREIHIYEDRTEKTEKTVEVLNEELVQFQTQSMSLSEACQSSNRSLSELTRLNQRLEKALNRTKRPTPQSSLPPFTKLFDIVPFEAFLELSGKDIGQLTLTQVRRCREFRKEVENVKSQIALLKETNTRLRTSKLQQHSSNLECQFRSCLQAFTPDSPSLRTFSSARELRTPYKGFPINMRFDTILASRLHTIQSAKESLKKQRKVWRTVTKKDLKSMDPEEVVRLVMDREECLERLVYFLRHPNPLKYGDQSTIFPEDSSLSEQVGSLVLETNRVGKK